MIWYDVRLKVRLKTKSADSIPPLIVHPLSFVIESPHLNETAFRNLVSSKTTGIPASMARAGLATLSVGYRGVIALRNAMFDLGWRKPQRVSVPVISVGNVTTGGTGKTPIVALIVQLLQHRGFQPAIISRGYGSVDGEPNDEKRVLERLCPDVPHEQNRSRYIAARRVTESKPIDVIVMDDGFQHRQFHRDLDVVLIDATCPFGYDRLLPRGFLREPPASLKRADAILITRSDMVSEKRLDEIIARVRRVASCPDERICQIDFRATGLINRAGQRSPLRDYSTTPVMLVSGIGNPDAFEDTCRRCGLKIVGTHWFPDHHHYLPQDLESIEGLRKKLGAAQVVTTLKDLVKLPDESHFWALEIAANFPESGQAAAFAEFLSNCVSEPQSLTGP